MINAFVIILFFLATDTVCYRLSGFYLHDNKWTAKWSNINNLPLTTFPIRIVHRCLTLEFYKLCAKKRIIFISTWNDSFIIQIFLMTYRQHYWWQSKISPCCWRKCFKYHSKTIQMWIFSLYVNHAEIYFVLALILMFIHTISKSGLK